MGEALKRRERERLRVIEEARRWASSLPWPSSAILVGSYARGDFNLWSDVDVIIVSSAFEGIRVMDRLRLLDPPPGYEAIPWTPEELVEALRRGNPLALEAAGVGVILRDDLGVKRFLGFLAGKRGRWGGGGN